MVQKLVYKPLLAYTYSWVSHGAAPPSTCTQAEEQAVSLALLNTSRTISDHMMRMSLFFILKSGRYLQCAPPRRLVERMQVQEDMGKEG